METIKTHGSVFSGIGGAELAAKWMGWSNVFHCEINPFCRRILRYWFTDSKSYEDITKTDFSQWNGKVDVLTGGFPCQPFSSIGKRRGKDDDRYLWPQMLRVIHEIRPRWVVCENVAGILTMLQPGIGVEMGSENDIFGENHILRSEQRYTIDEICEDIENEGYTVQAFVIPACAVGAPHRRDRVWIIAREVASDANCELLQDRNNETHAKREVEGLATKSSYIRKCGKKFPTQSFVCGGDDGIPERLDGISVSKWIEESTKSLGNAWVPKVAYEIFRVIELIEQNEKTQ